MTSYNCVICLDTASVRGFLITNCGHRFDKHCLKKWLKVSFIHLIYKELNKYFRIMINVRYAIL